MQQPRAAKISTKHQRMAHSICAGSEVFGFTREQIVVSSSNFESKEAVRRLRVVKRRTRPTRAPRHTNESEQVMLKNECTKPSLARVVGCLVTVAQAELSASGKKNTTGGQLGELKPSTDRFLSCKVQKGEQRDRAIAVTLSQTETPEDCAISRNPWARIIRSTVHGAILSQCG